MSEFLWGAISGIAIQTLILVSISCLRNDRTSKDINREERIAKAIENIDKYFQGCDDYDEDEIGRKLI